MPLGAKYAISRDRFLILNPLKQLSAYKSHLGYPPSTPCTTTFTHRARSTRMSAAGSSSPHALTGSNVMARLLSSNAQWARDVAASDPGFFVDCAKGQQPKALWIGCADSRVPESVITACAPGEIFTHRNIANQFPANDISAESVLEYAVGALGVTHVIVAGHTNCGGAAAALKAAQTGPNPPPSETSLQKWLSPLIQRVIAMDIRPDVPPNDALLAVVKENVKMQIENICNTDIVKNTSSTLFIHGWVYGLATGLIEDLELTRVISPSN